MIIYGYILKYLGVLGLWPILIQIVKYNYHLNGPWVPAYSVLPVYKKSRFYFTWFERIFPFFKQTEPDYYYYLSFGVFLLTAIVKYNWLKTWGNFSRSTYGCLNSVPIEINGIISVVITRSRVKPTLIAFQGCLLKICVAVCNRGRCISKNEHPLRPFWTMMKEKVLKEIHFECTV